MDLLFYGFIVIWFHCFMVRLLYGLIVIMNFLRSKKP